MKRTVLFVTTAVITMTGVFSISAQAAGRGSNGSCFFTGQGGTCFGQSDFFVGQGGSCFGQPDFFTGGGNSILSSLLSGGNGGNKNGTCSGQFWQNDTCTDEDCFDHYFGCMNGNPSWQNWPGQDKPDQSQPDQDKPNQSQPDQDKPNQSQPSQDGSTANSAYVQQVIDLVNQERAKMGLSPLKEAANVSSAASLRAQEITRSFSHTRPNGSSFNTAIKESGVSFYGAGENIAYGQKTPQEVMNVWMNSQSHRENILNRQYTTIGVGCYERNGVLYWVQLFTY